MAALSDIPEDMLSPFPPQKPYGQAAGDILFGPTPGPDGYLSDHQDVADPDPSAVAALTTANCAGEPAATRHVVAKRCHGCMYHEHGVCLDPTAKPPASVTAQAWLKQGLDPTTRAILAVAQKMMLKGKWGMSVRDELSKHYTTCGIVKAGPHLSELVAQPGYVGRIVFRPDLFDSCRSAKDFLVATGSQVTYALEAPQCRGCTHNRNRECRLLQRPFLSGGQQVQARDVTPHISELQSRGLISKTQALRFLAAAERQDPVSVLSDAIVSTQSKTPDLLDALQQAKPDPCYEPEAWSLPRPGDTPGSLEIKGAFAGARQDELDTAPLPCSEEIDLAGSDPGIGIDAFLGSD
jgi:hypothetical protein